MKAEQRVQYTV